MMTKIRPLYALDLPAKMTARYETALKQGNIRTFHFTNKPDSELREWICCTGTDYKRACTLLLRACPK